MNLGTRMWRRGANLEGDVANFIETEQLLQFEGSCFSFLQVGFWLLCCLVNLLLNFSSFLNYEMNPGPPDLFEPSTWWILEKCTLLIHEVNAKVTIGGRCCTCIVVISIFTFLKSLDFCSSISSYGCTWEEGTLTEGG